MNTFKHCNISNKSLARDYAKGKSFDFTIWNPSKTYVNDDYKQDFVSYQGRLYACIRTNTNTVPTDTFYWTLCIDPLTNGSVVNSTFLMGEGMPTDISVPNESVYLDLSSNVFYRFADGKWESEGTIDTKGMYWGEF